MKTRYSFSILKLVTSFSSFSKPNTNVTYNPTLSNFRTRKEITKQFNIVFCKGCGGCCLDCFCPFACYCWSMQQDALTIEELKPKDANLIGDAIEAVAKAAKSLV